jgi:putative ABC transport system permease protein
LVCCREAELFQALLLVVIRRDVGNLLVSPAGPGSMLVLLPLLMVASSDLKSAPIVVGGFSLRRGVVFAAASYAAVKLLRASVNELHGARLTG